MQLTWRILSQDSESKGGTIISISSLYTQHIPQQKKISCRIEGRKRISSTVDRTMKLTKWTNQNAHKGGEKEKYNKETQKVEMTDLVGSRPCLVGLSVVWPTWDYFTGLSFWLKQTNGAQNTYLYFQRRPNHNKTGGAGVVHGEVHSKNIAILWGPINELWDTWALPSVEVSLNYYNLFLE